MQKAYILKQKLHLSSEKELWYWELMPVAIIKINLTFLFSKTLLIYDNFIRTNLLIHVGWNIQTLIQYLKRVKQTRWQ